MPKEKTLFRCSQCDAQFPRWEGRCRECGAWGTLKETAFARPVAAAQVTVVDLSTVASDTSNDQRLSSGFGECDRVLGGGFVAGSFLLVGGDPGIGKSTLLLQIARNLAQSPEGHGILYVSGEESAAQVKQRLDRVGLTPEGFHFLGDPSLDAIEQRIATHAPSFVVIDSLQTIQGGAGVVLGKPSELRDATERLMLLAKKTGTIIVLIGHVTKEGTVAGPKAIEHLVDAVLYLERSTDGPYRILRAIKNRFGGIHEIGVWHMTQQGLQEVENPSAAFLTTTTASPGSCVTGMLQGSRVFLVEVQALVSKSRFGYPQRRSTGFDQNRLQLIIAVLTKIVRLPLAYSDIHLNVVGGLKVNEPAADLAVALAIASATKNTPLQPKLIALGEIGLQGELRVVNDIERRLEEAARLGFQYAVTPPGYAHPAIETLHAKTIAEAIDIALQTH